MLNEVFRKTDAGRAEIGRRQAGLAPATRRVLILVKGREGLPALAALGLPDLHGHLALLLARGLIEPDVAPPPEPAPLLEPVFEPVATQPSAPMPSAEPTAEETQAVQMLKRQAFQRLSQHFGPDTAAIAEAVLAAVSLAQFRSAVTALEPRLAVYLGRRGAASEVRVLRGE